MTAPPPADLGLVVVIPARDEPDIEVVLDSLGRCDAPGCGVEILVVVNDSEADAPAVRAASQRTLATLADVAARPRGLRYPVHALDHRWLPAREAGVGLARKLGMDEAVARLGAARNPDGVIACLDADCEVSGTYLHEVVAAFSGARPPLAATVEFEHRLEGLEAARALAIARYELFLRYYRQGLASAGCPYALHTVGSCIAVRRAAYQRHGGMNRRQAGEDFYFVHKLGRAGPVTEIVDATVFPSSRASERVPFGTGRAMRWQSAHPEQGWPVLAPECFVVLGEIVGALGRLREVDAPAWSRCLGPSVADYLDRRGLVRRVAEARRHTASAASFEKRMLSWFDAFEAMKLLRHLSEGEFDPLGVEEAAARLLEMDGRPAESDLLALLHRYRGLDRRRERFTARARDGREVSHPVL